MAEAERLSAAAHQRLSDELEDLTTRGRTDIAAKIEAARAHGDLSENGDYHAAKETQGLMEARIQHLTRLLDNAEIMERASDGGVVGPGSIVEVSYDGDEPERFLVGSIEEQRDDLTVVSPGSPMGQSLLGASAGDEVAYESPAGPVRITVTAVE